jgi:hypothetical protein
MLPPAVGLLMLAVAVAVAENPGTPTPGGTSLTTFRATSTTTERVKHVSKYWKNYKGCDNTCLSLCLEKPTDFDMKCSVLYSNATLVNSPPISTCKKVEVVRNCRHQCLCACKRCGFCKQGLVNSCPEDRNAHECADHALYQIIHAAKCD